MTTPNRQYTEIPGAAVPDVPYRVNLALREIDVDVQTLANSAGAAVTASTLANTKSDAAAAKAVVASEDVTRLEGALAVIDGEELAATVLEVQVQAAAAAAASTAAAADAATAADLVDQAQAPTDAFVASVLAEPTSATAQQAAADFIPSARGADTFKTVNRRLDFKDLANSPGSVINIDHRGDGTGNVASPGQAYGLDIHNMPGAKAAIVVHQYSSVERALALDNTGSAPMIEINNTQNLVLNPGSDGTGDFFLLRDHGAMILRLDKDLIFRAGGTKVPTFLHTGAKALSVQTASTFNGECMDVTKAGTGAGNALKVNNAGSGIGLSIAQTGTGQAFRIDAKAIVNTGVYAALIEAYDYGPSITTEANGGTTLKINKKGTGNGGALDVTNLGTGQTITARDASGVVSQIDANGEYRHNVNGAGIVLKSPSGQKWRITVNDAGALTTTAIA